MGKIILVRHGEVSWNARACYTGWTDLALTDKGIQQAQAIAKRLRREPLEAVYSSDLQRASATAEVIAAPHDLTVVIDTDLRELNYGEWEGVAEVDLPVRSPDLYAAWSADPAGVATPGGESFTQLRDRALGAFDRIMARHPDSTVAVVGHKSVNRTMLCHWLAVGVNRYKRIGQDNAAVNVIAFTPDRVQVESVNDTCHLSHALITGEV